MTREKGSHERWLAGHDFIAAKALAKLHKRRGHRYAMRDELVRMRNACVAYHVVPVQVSRADALAASVYSEYIAWLRADNERLREEPDTPFGFASEEEWQASELAKACAEVERLRSGIRDLRRGLLRGLKPGDGSEPEPTTEVSGVVACLDTLAREDGAS